MEGAITTYYYAVNYLVDTYATDDVTAKTVADMICFTQISNKLPTEYPEAQLNKAVVCDAAHNEYVLDGIFIEGLLEPICHSMRSYCTYKKSDTRPGVMPPHRRNYKRGWHGMHTTCNMEKPSNRGRNNGR